MSLVGLFGGTFDPVHNGHLRAAFELLERLGFDELRFIPCGQPPHRQPAMASGPLRLRMLQAAIQGEPRFTVDPREIERRGPSWTVDTARSFRAEWPDSTFCLLMGADAFQGLPEWHQWEALLDLVHIVVVHRPGWTLPATGLLGDIVRARRATGFADLTTGAGRIHVEPITPLQISSTQIRTGLRAGGDPRYLMPDAVRQIIVDTECYAEKASHSEGAQGTR